MEKINTYCVPVLNNVMGLKKLVDSLYKYTPHNFYVYVCFNGTQEDFIVAQKELGDKVHLWIKPYKNLGFGKAMNQMIKLSTTSFVTIANDDVEVLYPTWWEEVMALFEKDPQLMGFNPHSFINKKSSGERVAQYDTKDEYTQVDIDSMKAIFHAERWYTGCCTYFTICRKQLFDEVGLFDESFGQGCFLPETQIVSLLGMRKISDLRNNMPVYGKSGNCYKSEIIEKEYNNNIYELELVGNNEKVKVTPDHKIFVVPKRKSTVVWSRQKLQIVEKRVDELKEKDLVIFPKLTNTGATPSFKNFTKEYRKGTLNIIPKLEVDKDLFKIFGLWLAEGHLMKHRKKELSGVGWTFHLKETEYAEFIKRYFDKFGISTKIKLRPEKTICEVSIYNVPLADLFYELFNEGSHHKSIHQIILSSDNNLLKSLFEGYRLGDGCIHKSRNVRSRYDYIQLSIKTVSKQLAKDIHYILNRLFIPSLVNYGKINVIVISQTYLSELIGYEIKQRQYKGRSQIKSRNLVFKDDNFIYRPIKKITKLHYQGKVFDLKIEVDHSYIVEDMLVHNSGEDYDLMVRAGRKGSGYKICGGSCVMVKHWWGGTKDNLPKDDNFISNYDLIVKGNERMTEKWGPHCDKLPGGWSVSGVGGPEEPLDKVTRHYDNENKRWFEIIEL